MKVLVQPIVDWVRREFGISLTSVAPVAGGADAAATVWRAVARGGGEYAVKLSARDTDAGLLVARELAAAGIPGIAAPLTNAAGGPSSSHEGIQLSIFDWIAGPRGADTEMTIEHWRSFGSLLGRVHATKLPAALESRLPREEFRNPAIAAARSCQIEFRDDSPAFDAMSRSMVAGWLAASESIAALVDRCAKLAAALRDRPAPTAVCHGDAHTINLIIAPDGRPFLLDWDEVSIAPPERDLMFVIDGGIFLDKPVTEEQQRAFTAGYGTLDIDPIRLAYYYCTRALEDITEFAKEILDRTAKSEAREFALRCILDQLSPTGMVNAALGIRAAD